MDKLNQVKETTQADDVSDLINWAELSRRLAGTRSVVLRNAIPKRHKRAVNRLKIVLRAWVEEMEADKEEYNG